MDVKSFATLLSKELISRGIPKELAVKHAVSLVRTFDEEDLREISAYTSAEEFQDLSDSLCDLIKDKELSGKKTTVTPAVPNPTIEFPDSDVRIATGTFPKVSGGNPTVPDTATKEIPIVPAGGQVNASDEATKEIPIIPPKGQMNIPDGATREIPIVSAVPDGATREIPIPGAVPVSEQMQTRQFGAESAAADDATRSFPMIKTSEISMNVKTASDITVINLPVVSAEDEEEHQEIYLDEETEEIAKKTVLTKRGKAFFWGIAIATSPITLIIALLVLGVFALGIACVCAFIVITLLLVCAEAVLGSGLTLVGIIYGAIEIVSKNPGIGIYEIGLGICLGGLALCLGILTYNLAVLGLPYVLKQLLTFEGYCLKRVGPMLERFREECNRL